MVGKLHPPLREKLAMFFRLLLIVLTVAADSNGERAVCFS